MSYVFEDTDPKDMPEFVMATFGMAKYYGDVYFGNHVFCKIKYTENSYAPDKMDFWFPKELLTACEDLQ